MAGPVKNWRRRVQLLTARGVPWVRSSLNSRLYRVLNEVELHASRKSDTVFIFGSGYSINEITYPEWSHFQEHDTLGFNWFVRQDKIRVDYHLTRELSPDDLDPSVWRPAIWEHAELIRNSPYYRETIFLVQAGWRAINGNRLVGMRLLPERARVFRFFNHRRGRLQPPSSTLNEGLVHGESTLTDCINFGLILGWRSIVLVGVDLYDRRYFWLRHDKTRDNDRLRSASHTTRHNAAQGLTEHLGKWRDVLLARGCTLYVYNPRSLLASVLPVYDKGQIGAYEERASRGTQ